MSFDLYFYTERGLSRSAEEFEKYLLQNGCVRADEYPQWSYSNETTGVYFLFELQDKSDDPEEIQLFHSFEGFDNTDVTFNINFIRPNFFGLEAFPVVEKLMKELDLYALNPQSESDPDNPRKETADDYYSDWSRANLKVSSEYYDDFGLIHFPLDKSNDLWRYNFNRVEMQGELGDDYFVPKLILVRQAATGDLITLSTWTQHIPNVFPPADYFVLNRTRKKLFRTVEESGLISKAHLYATFGSYLEPFDFKDCTILHPIQAAEIEDIFNNVEFDVPLHGFDGGVVELENVTNAERAPIQKKLDED